MFGTILSFFTGGNKIWLYLIAGIAITAIVAGFWFYQRSIISGLEEQIRTKDRKIEALNIEITGLRIDNDRLKLSVVSLEQDIERRVNEMADIRLEIAEVNRLRDESSARLAEFEAKQRDAERQARIKQLREGERASLLLRLYNNNIDCFVENFNNTNGRCVGGKFRE